ncbi:MAG: ABC transporter permease, partial [Rhodocyclaceae bacterium]|nr:ABC transporter permease [Rhodocyclaceae bacterium]
MRLVLVDLSLALRSVLRQGHRTAIAMIAVSVGVIAMILSAGFIEWLMEGMRESTIHSQLGHIQVVRPGYVEKGTSDPYKYLIVGEKDAMQAMQAEKGMEALAPRLAFSGLLSLGDTTLTFIGQGVAPEAEAKLSTSVTIISGENLDPADPKG